MHNLPKPCVQTHGIKVWPIQWFLDWAFAYYHLIEGLGFYLGPWNEKIGEVWALNWAHLMKEEQRPNHSIHVELPGPGNSSVGAACDLFNCPTV